MDEFYTHPGMASGRLNKCKTCYRKSSNEYGKRMSQNPEWREKELARVREKARRFRASPGYVPARTGNGKKWSLRNPEKRKAMGIANEAINSGKLRRQPCVVCGNKAQAHHEDYSKPLEVKWLCAKHHAELHMEKRRAARMQITSLT